MARTPATVAWVRRYSTLGEHGLLWHGVAASGMLLDRRRARQWAGASLRVFLGSCISVAIKRAIGRQRPAVEDLPHLMATPTGLSFPSSHSTTSFAAARAFRRLLPGPPLYAAAVLMAISRLYLGVHYPSDIAAGAALGSVIGR